MITDSAVEAHGDVDSVHCDGAADTQPDWRKGALLGFGVAAGTAAVALADPTDSGIPVCWSAGFFGIDCPLCGGLRCVNSLARGDWLAAADHNVILAIALPMLVIGWVAWMVSAARGTTMWLPRLRPWAWTTAILLVAAFTVVRNLDLGPIAHWLAATAG